jgi:hypothetical protein
LKTIINEGRRLPDGLALDVAAGHIYWSNMGDPKRAADSLAGRVKNEEAKSPGSRSIG